MCDRMYKLTSPYEVKKEVIKQTKRVFNAGRGVNEMKKQFSAEDVKEVCESLCCCIFKRSSDNKFYCWICGNSGKDSESIKHAFDCALLTSKRLLEECGK